MAFQIETALSPNCSRAQRQSLKAEIHTALSYLREIEETWLNAKWASRVFAWVVKRAGLMLREAGPCGDDLGSGNPQNAEPNFSGSDQVSNDQRPDLPGYQTPLLDFIPDNWLQDMIDQGVVDGQDHAMFEIFGAPF